MGGRRTEQEEISEIVYALVKSLDCQPLEPLVAFKQGGDKISSNLCFRKITQESVGRINWRWGRQDWSQGEGSHRFNPAAKI